MNSYSCLFKKKKSVSLKKYRKSDFFFSKSRATLLFTLCNHLIRSGVNETHLTLKLKSFHPWIISLADAYLTSIPKTYNFPWNMILNLQNKFGLEKQKKVFTVLRSPHIDKKSRDQYCLTTFSKVFKYGFTGYASFPWSILFITKLLYSLPSGVGFNIYKKINCIY